MNWSFQIAAPFGIPVRVHWTFLLLLVFLTLSGEGGRADPMRLIVALSVFAGVVLHELGHSVAALRYGIPVRDITLWPLGGIARLDRFPPEPGRQLVVALAGPAVSFGLGGIFAAVAYFLIPASAGSDPLAWFAPATGEGAKTGMDAVRTWAWSMAEINLGLGVFNLVPALPMDGGRVLRALLAMTRLRERATQLAARVGQVLAVGMGLGGLLAGHIWLILIAFFVFFAAEREWQVDAAASRLRGIPAWKAMLRPVATAGRMTSVRSLAHHAARNEQQDFPILEGSHVVGLVTRWDLMRALIEGHKDDPVFTIMHKDMLVLSPFDTLDRLYQFRIPFDRAVMPVIHHERIIGLVTPEMLRQLA